MGRGKGIIPPYETKDVLDAYERDRPAAGHEFASWVEATAAAVGIQGSRVRRIILDYTDGFLHSVRAQSNTYAQRVAATLGGGIEDAIQTLQEGLRASKKRVFVDKKTGEVQVYETEDWATRANCASKLIDIHGGWAPQRIEVDSRTITATISTEDLLKQLDQMKREYRKIAQSESARTLAAPEAVGDDGGVEGADGGGRLLLLADGMHSDG